MALEDLIVCLVQALSDHGNLDVLLTTEKETQLYNEATVMILPDSCGKLFVKLEGVRDTEIYLEGMEDYYDEDE